MTIELLEFTAAELVAIRDAARAAAVAPDGEAGAAGAAGTVEPIDDQVALWLRAHRDRYDRTSFEWQALDDVLGDYRLHRAVGVPLDQAVADGGTEEQ